MATRGRPVNFAVRGDILSALVASGGMTLAQLVARVDGPTVSTVATAVDRLETQGLIRIGQRLAASGRGRPQNLWTLTDAGVLMANRIQADGFSAIGTEPVAADGSVMSVDASEPASATDVSAYVTDMLAVSAAAAENADDLPDLFSVGGSPDSAEVSAE